MSDKERSMATVKAPESIPCKFDQAWKGKCGKPTTNGWCDEHESRVCCVCGEKATQSCDYTGSLVCGASLCSHCQHAPYPGSGHVTKEVAEEMRRKKKEEETAKVASRESPVQRVDENTGLPLNLFELKKGDLSGYPLTKIYALQLKHGLMGYFPAIYRGSKEVVYTADKELLTRVARSLSPRRFKMDEGDALVSEALNVAYILDSRGGVEEEERSTPEQLLTRERYDQLMEAEESPFMWAPGLIGDDMTNEDFAETLDHMAQECGVAPAPMRP